MTTIKEVREARLKATVFIRNNATGEVRQYQDDYWHPDDNLFMWTEGNYACDCNRELFWLRAGGREPAWDDTQCSEGRFSALYAIREDGRRVDIDPLLASSEGDK